MKKHITISLDPLVHDLAQKTAKKKRTSLSALIESLLQSANSEMNEHRILQQMIGSGSLRNSVAGTDPLYDSLKTKYLTK